MSKLLLFVTLGAIAISLAKAEGVMDLLKSSIRGHKHSYSPYQNYGHPHGLGDAHYGAAHSPLVGQYNSYSPHHGISSAYPQYGSSDPYGYSSSPYSRYNVYENQHSYGHHLPGHEYSHDLEYGSLPGHIPSVHGAHLLGGHHGGHNSLHLEGRHGLRHHVNHRPHHAYHSSGGAAASAAVGGGGAAAAASAGSGSSASAFGGPTGASVGGGHSGLHGGSHLGGGLHHSSSLDDLGHASGLHAGRYGSHAGHHLGGPHHLPNPMMPTHSGLSHMGSHYEQEMAASQPEVYSTVEELPDGHKTSTYVDYQERPIEQTMAAASGTFAKDDQGLERSSYSRSTEHIQNKEDGHIDDDHYYQAQSYGKTHDDNLHEASNRDDEDYEVTPTGYRKKKRKGNYVKNHTKTTRETGSGVLAKDRHQAGFSKSMNKLVENVNKNKVSHVNGVAQDENLSSSQNLDDSDEDFYDSDLSRRGHSIPGLHMPHGSVASGSGNGGAAAASAAGPGGVSSSASVGH